jgi:hypothetical protein
MKVFVNKQKVDLDGLATITAGELLSKAKYVEHELFQLQGEGDPTGGTKLAPETVITLKNGMHFRALPKNRNLGGE